MSKRVVITGLGMVTALGEGTERNWKRMISGESGVDRISSFDATTLPVRIAAEIRDFDPNRYIKNRKWLKMITRPITIGLAAAKLAVEDSKLDLTEMPSDRVGVYVGSGESGSPLSELFPVLDVSTGEDGSMSYQRFGSEGIWRMNPMFLLRALPNNLLCYITIEYNARGPNNNFLMSPVASAQAIGEAFKAVEKGYADVIITGGSDSLVGVEALIEYSEMGLLSRHDRDPKGAFQPFDRKRSGFVLGEGAGILILEELSHALKRNAPIYGEVTGYGCSSDGYHIFNVSPRGEGISLAMKKALKDSGSTSNDIGYICAHGNATKKGDLAETIAIKTVFGKKAEQIPVSSIKPMVGHLGAASGAVELIVSVLTMTKGVIPPTINYTTSDPQCDLDYVPNAARAATIDTAISVNYGIGGQNTALMIKKFE